MYEAGTAILIDRRENQSPDWMWSASWSMKDLGFKPRSASCPNASSFLVAIVPPRQEQSSPMRRFSASQPPPREAACQSKLFSNMGIIFPRKSRMANTKEGCWPPPPPAPPERPGVGPCLGQHLPHILSLLSPHHTRFNELVYRTPSHLPCRPGRERRAKHWSPPGGSHRPARGRAHCGS